MAKGDVYAAEYSTFSDRETGVIIQQLTDYRGHSNHLYFTHSPYYDGGRRMLFHSDRGNAANLFELNLQTWEIRQLTDYGPGRDAPKPFSSCVNPLRNEAYFWAGRSLYAIDLDNLSERKLWERPLNMLGQTPNCGADGRFIYFALNLDLSDKLKMDLGRGYVGFAEYWEARPHSQIARIPTAGGEPEILWEEDYWIGHINTSPTNGNLLTFCHEGPWAKVDQRIWGLDASTGRVWKIRTQSEGDVIGHEYWFADGSRVGYHGRRSGIDALWGHADPMGGDFRDFPLSPGSMHFHSLGADMLVSDGSPADPYILLWRRDEDSCECRRLCKHRCSFHIQRLHVHPTITPDGRSVLFTSDLKDYGNIFLVDIPEWESLPRAD